MTLARNKRVGAETECILADWLNARRLLHAVRPRLNGSEDVGDIHVLFGKTVVVIEVKSTSKGWDVQQWLRELRTEMANVAALYHDVETVIGWVAVRPKGKPDPADWAWITTTSEVWP